MWTISTLAVLAIVSLAAGQEFEETETPVPEPTLPPTPTLSPGNPDFCTAPKVITCGETVWQNMGSATSDHISDPFEDQWFLLAGTGQEVWASTCDAFTNFDTVVEIYLGSCDNLNFVGISYADSCNIASHKGHSNVSWNSYVGDQYRIRVYSYSGNPMASDLYGLTIGCGSRISTPTPSPTLSPGNADFCTAPKVISCGETIRANMGAATPDQIMDSVQDQWFLLAGTGQEVWASTCDAFTNFDTVVEVYLGSCDNLNFVAISYDTECTNGFYAWRSNVSWNSYLGDEYRIRVRPYSEYIDESERYGLTIGCGSRISTPTPSPTLSPGNADSCTAPKVISCGEIVRQNMTDATPDQIMDNFWDHWFLLAGTGQEVWASTCDAFTNFDTVVEVYLGSCDSLAVVASNDDAGCAYASYGLLSNVSWNSYLGNQYRIRVRPFGEYVSGSEQYSLTIGCGSRISTPTPTPTPHPPPRNDRCADARQLKCGNTKKGSLRYATSSDPDSINDGFQDRWFSVEHDGLVTLSTCNNYTGFDTYLEVFTGDCASLSLLTSNDDTPITCNANLGKITSLVSWTALPDVAYRVRVRGYRGAIGNYRLTTTCE